MNKRLLIMRHGKSDWSVPVDDFNRPLKKRGRRAVKKIGLWLRRQALIPDYILSSPAIRAKQTAEKLVKTMALREECIQFDSRLYEADLDNLIKVLADCPANAQCVIIVGHNPGLEDLLNYLQGGTLDIPADGKLLPTATAAVLKMPNDWQKLSNACAKLDCIIRPASSK